MSFTHPIKRELSVEKGSAW